MSTVCAERICVRRPILCFAFHDPGAAPSDGHEGAVSRDLVGDRELRGALDLGFFEGVLASVDLYALEKGIGGQNGQILKMRGSENDRTVVSDEACAVEAVGDQSAEMPLFQIL